MEYSEITDVSGDNLKNSLNVNENDLENLFKLYSTNKLTPDDREYLGKTKELLEYICERRHVDLSNKWTESDIKIIVEEFISLNKGNKLLGSGSKNKGCSDKRLLEYFLLCLLISILTQQTVVVEALLIHDLIKSVLEAYNE